MNFFVWISSQANNDEFRKTRFFHFPVMDIILAENGISLIWVPLCTLYGGCVPNGAPETEKPSSTNIMHPCSTA